MTLRRCRLLQAAHQFTVRIPGPLWQRLETYAHRHGNTLNRQLTEFIEAGLLDSPINTFKQPVEHLPWLMED